MIIHTLPFLFHLLWIEILGIIYEQSINRCFPTDHATNPRDQSARQEDIKQGQGNTGGRATVDPTDRDDNEISSALADDQAELQDGMLLRDVPKRTTFYDPVAERQMSQTDAKLFYQRSKIDLRSGIAGAGGWNQSSPNDSPTIASGSRPVTEYGADSLILDQDGGMLANQPAGVSLG